MFVYEKKCWNADTKFLCKPFNCKTRNKIKKDRLFVRANCAAHCSPVCERAEGAHASFHVFISICVRAHVCVSGCANVRSCPRVWRYTCAHLRRRCAKIMTSSKCDSMMHPISNDLIFLRRMAEYQKSIRTHLIHSVFYYQIWLVHDRLGIAFLQSSYLIMPRDGSNLTQNHVAHSGTNHLIVV